MNALLPWVLAPSIALAAAKPASPPPTVSLVPVAPERIAKCDASDFEKHLRKGLEKSKRFALAPPGEAGTLRLEILACEQFQVDTYRRSGAGASARESDSGGPMPFHRPSNRVVTLRAVLTGGTRVVVQSREAVLTMTDAARMLRGVIETALEKNPALQAAPASPAPAP